MRARATRARIIYFILYFKINSFIIFYFILEPHPDSLSVAFGLGRAVLSQGAKAANPRHFYELL
jgi:hypothetical protein